MNRLEVSALGVWLEDKTMRDEESGDRLFYTGNPNDGDGWVGWVSPTVGTGGKHPLTWIIAKDGTMCAMGYCDSFEMGKTMADSALLSWGAIGSIAEEKGENCE